VGTVRVGNRIPLILRLMDRTQKTPTCWYWTGTINGDGYGTFTVYGYRAGARRTTVGAHRLVYEELAGPIPGDRQIDHLCRVRHCVNPAHLEPVPKTVNVLRGEGPTATNARKTHCIHGHALPPAGGVRHCSPCAVRRATEHKAANLVRYNARRRELRAQRRAAA
jgi:hypothetical protein